ncbi:SIS domain-containing protein [Sphingobacteriales bacterium UPWRP_1]|nr:phosphoheptose isomerase [Sphingobacteriales bacterium TSM_CSM]PSJ73163.1 SIS domain-containing protein [Sphingobacteriales bacterium UPWRP_1]
MTPEQIAEIIQQSVAVKQAILQNTALLQTIQRAGFALVNAFKNKHRVWLCGNGGSAADAQHIAAELSGRFYHDRPPLPAEALHVNTSYLTAVANDYGYEQVFARMVQGFAQKGDVLIGITTSGKSANVLKALQQAQQAGVYTIGLCGNVVNHLEPCCNLVIAVPSGNTPRIQEAHILIGHILCEMVERELFSLIA